MPAFVETEKSLEGFEERPEEISPLTIERKEVITPVPTQFTQKVTSSTGQTMIQTPQGQAITITLPDEQTTLTDKAKGSSDDSVTWFARFWLRIIKKAVHFGWNVLLNSNVKSQNSKL
jgi:hypothetical protein